MVDFTASEPGPVSVTIQRGGYLEAPYYDVEASAGGGALVGEENLHGHLAFRAEWVREMGLDMARCAALSVRGDSMEPTLADGDTILVDLSQRDGADGIFCLRVGDTLLVKRVQHRLDGSLSVISDNPAYSPELLHPGEQSAFEVLGAVVWAGKTLRRGRG